MSQPNLFAPHPHRPGRSLDARCLYLMGPQALRASSTGEALVLSSRDGQIRRFPVARLVRIVCAQHVEWSGAALVLCQQRGVTITWLDHQGRPLGHLQPHAERPRDLAELLDVLCTEAPAWGERFHNWVRHQRQRILGAWRSQRKQAGQPVGRLEWECAMQRIAYLGSVAERLPSAMHGMVAALVAERLSGHGLRHAYPCAGPQDMALGETLSGLLWARMNLCAGTLAQAIERPEEAAALFERHSRELNRHLQEHLGSLQALARCALLEL